MNPLRQTGRIWRRLLVVSALAIASMASAAAGAGTPHLKLTGLLNHNYSEARAKLIRAGYRPLRLQHDERDLECRASFCLRFPEAMECGGSAYRCHYIFERPDALRRHGNDRYMMVVGEGEPDPDSPARSDQLVIQIGSRPDSDDMKEVWARRDLKRRGCLPSSPVFLRDCDKNPPLPDVPGLPPSPPSK
jgi:hypothetical protein